MNRYFFECMCAFFRSCFIAFYFTQVLRILYVRNRCSHCLGHIHFNAFDMCPFFFQPCKMESRPFMGNKMFCTDYSIQFYLEITNKKGNGQRCKQFAMIFKRMVKRMNK